MDNRLYYFMAHAPAEPQEWFEPVMETEKPKYGNPGGEYSKWMSNYKKQRYIQWPLAWAKEQVSLLMKNQL